MVLGRCLALMPHATERLAGGIHLTNVDGLALVAQGLTPKVALMDVGPAHGMHLTKLRGRRSLSERLEEAPTRATVVAAHKNEAEFLDVEQLMRLCLMPVAYTFEKFRLGFLCLILFRCSIHVAATLNQL